MKKKYIEVIKNNGEYVKVGSEYFPKFMIKSILRFIKGKNIAIVADNGKGGEETLLGTDIYDFWSI